MTPVVRELAKHSDGVISKVCVTAQHREMLDQVLDLLGIVPDYDLDIMQESQSLSRVTVEVLTKLEPVLWKEKPDWVLREVTERPEEPLLNTWPFLLDDRAA